MVLDGWILAVEAFTGTCAKLFELFVRICCLHPFAGAWEPLWTLEGFCWLSNPAVGFKWQLDVYPQKSMSFEWFAPNNLIAS